MVGTSEIFFYASSLQTIPKAEAFRYGSRTHLWASYNRQHDIRNPGPDRGKHRAEKKETYLVDFILIW